MDGPIYLKDGVTLSGTYDAEDVPYGRLNLYDGPKLGAVEEAGIVVLDGVSDAEASASPVPRIPPRVVTW